MLVSQGGVGKSRPRRCWPPWWAELWHKQTRGCQRPLPFSLRAEVRRPVGHLVVSGQGCLVDRAIFFLAQCGLRLEVQPPCRCGGLGRIPSS